MNEQADSTAPRDAGAPQKPANPKGLRSWLVRLVKPRNGEASALDVIGGLIETEVEGENALGAEERALLGNILELRGRSVEDVMIPRADILAVQADSTLAEVVEFATREGHSRMPVYDETLDDASGMIHIRDLLAWTGRDAEFSLEKVKREILFVPPSMRVLELLLEMRVSRIHMALVVDEYGGIDGLVTIEDLVEEIVGEIEDEHDADAEAQWTRRPDGTVDADARATLEAMEEMAGALFNDEERQDIDTLGGLVVSLAGRVPIRGELVRHPSGVEFQVLDADPRRVKRLRIRLPAPPPEAKE
jgi:CBS domain containing-hemolysin-like protein